LIYQGRYGDALLACKQELDVLNGVPGDNSASITTTQANMAVCYQRWGELEKSLELHKKVLESEIQGNGNEHVSVAMTHSNIGAAHKKMGRNESAKFHLNVALQIYFKQLGKIHPYIAEAKNVMGSVLKQSGDQGGIFTMHLI
jgi:tetratricopeptide (TPR) repeat protein